MVLAMQQTRNSFGSGDVLIALGELGFGCNARRTGAGAATLELMRAALPLPIWRLLPFSGALAGGQVGILGSGR